MERIHMNHIKDLICRLRARNSERRILQDMQISRPTVHKYYELAKKEGYLEAGNEIPPDEYCKACWGQDHSLRKLHRARSNLVK